MLVCRLCDRSSGNLNKMNVRGKSRGVYLPIARLSFSELLDDISLVLNVRRLIRGMTMMSGLLDLTSLSPLAGMSQLGSSCFMFIFIFCYCLWCMFVPLVGHFDVVLFTDNSSGCKRTPYRVYIIMYSNFA